MAAHHGDTQTCNELRQRTVTALLDGCLHTLEGLHAEAVCFDDGLTVLLQLVEITVVANPAMADQLLQRRFGQALDVHPGLLTEVGELPNQLGCTVRILTKQLSGATGGGLLDQFLAAAGADHWQPEGIAFGQVPVDLGDDHVGLVDFDLIAHTKLELLEDAQVVQVSPGYLCAIDGHRLKQARNAHHTGSGGCQVDAQEPGPDRIILPLQGDHAVFVMTGGAQTGSQVTVIIFHDQTVHGIGVTLGIEALDGIPNQIRILHRIHIDIGHNGECVPLQ